MNFKDYINNKRIVIVGPAPSSMSNTKDFIESFDVVMRFNSAVPIKEEVQNNIGSRTDILCNCLEEDPISGGKIDPFLWKENGVKWVLSPYPKNWFSEVNIKRFEDKNKNVLEFELFDLNYYNQIEKSLGTRPNSGLLGILHLLKFDIKQIHITGITFGRGGYRKGYKDNITPEQYNKLANGPWHTQKPQEDYFRNIQLKDKRITLDKQLKEIMGNK